MYYYLGIAVLVIVIVWTIGSYLVIYNIEEPKFTVLERKDGYDIRQYDSYIIAETDVTGSYDEATNKGFRIIADYIFGNNTSRSSIAMTAPVLENESQKSPSEQIAMTVPVVETEKNEGMRTISFVLPSAYTVDTLPKPNNPQVSITQVPAKKVAVMSFTLYPTAARVTSKKKALLNALQNDNVEIVGAVQVARYNPPFSMPLMLRNEIIIPIQ